ncbi:hypothetical protein [Rathayibacter sp. AY1F9]|uniref:hypothetical protein n=1 Tax=Rathayibacter sp. AY1F9 TaxID=2080563 RepID=UPI0011B0089F|nr:hypothetical protein [Rathayibacter sp. AY1F9]
MAAVNERYRATTAVASDGVSLFVVADENGAALNAAVRAVARMGAEDGSDLWEDVLGAAKSLRWQLAFRPQPLEFNPSVTTAAHAVAAQADALRPALGDDGAALLDALTEAAERVAAEDPPVGAYLLESVLEVGPTACMVVADGTHSRGEIGSWLGPLGFRVLSPGMLADATLIADIAYVVGPPRLMRTSLVTAPPSPEVSFFVPSWFGDRSLPETVIADYAQGAIRPRVRVFELGTLKPTADEVPAEPEPIEDFAPPPVWGSQVSAHREPSVDEVVVRKVLLSGGYAIWMDDGERIRTLDPSQPAGERVSYADVAAVEPGTYLVLRLGVTERAVLYEATLASMGVRRRAVVESSQERWKQALLGRLRSAGRPHVESAIRRLGVRAAEQAEAWTRPTLARPQLDSDFKLLLQWLELAEEPAFSNATEFRRARFRAASRMREQLELAMASADIEELRARGHVKVDGAGFADIIATRVLAISPHTNVIPRHDAREPFLDGGGRWLE